MVFIDWDLEESVWDTNHLVPLFAYLFLVYKKGMSDIFAFSMPRFVSLDGQPEFMDHFYLLFQPNKIPLLDLELV